MFIGLSLILFSIAVPILLVGTTLLQTSGAAALSQTAGMISLVLMGWAQMLALRWSPMERVFGGYDRIYQLHRWIGAIAFGAMYLHSSVDAGLPGQQGLENDLSEGLGDFALNGITFLVILSVLKFLPYNLWRFSHLFMGPLCAVAALHFITIPREFGLLSLLGGWVMLFCVLGALAAALNVLRYLKGHGVMYRVAHQMPVNGAMRLQLRPVGHARIRTHKPGQFAFFRFQHARFDQTHPFTISSAPREDGRISVTIRPLGDFTKSLIMKDHIGEQVQVDGPFGRFVRRGSGPEIWIGAGVGVTPFRAFCQDLPKSGPDHPIHMFICARDTDSAPHLEEFQEFAAQYQNFHLHEVYSDHGHRLSPEWIAAQSSLPMRSTRAYFCGPCEMGDILARGLRRMGLRKFHRESFEIRDDFGISKLVGRFFANRDALRRSVLHRLQI